MAFNIVAAINFQTPNLSVVAKQVQGALKGVKGKIDVSINDKGLSSLTTATSKIGALAKEVEKLKRETAGVNSLFTNMSRTISSTADSAKTAATSLKQVSGALKQVATAQKQVDKTAEKTSGTIKKVNADLTSFGQLSAFTARRFAAFAVGVGGGLAIFNKLREGIVEAVKFQHEMVRLAQVAQKPTAQLKVLESEITRLATSLGVTSSSIQQVALTLQQAGFQTDEIRAGLEGLAKTGVAATFEDLNETTDAFIAISKQFNISAKDMGSTLGAINKVSADFAVESSDIVKAVSRAGSAFAAVADQTKGGKHAFNEFIALFTSVRQTTRESAETIATGLRTIFTRIQRPQTIQYLKNLGIEVTDAKGQFIGAYEAIRRVGTAIQEMGLKATDPRFAQLATELGGYRQINKVIPLLQQLTVQQQALNSARQGEFSIDKSVAASNESLIIQLTKLNERFLALFRTVTNSATFQVFAKSALMLSNSLLNVAEAASGLLPLLGAFAAFKLGKGALGFAGDFAGFFKNNKGGGAGALRFATGGNVPGSGNGDTIPAMLTPKEFVVTKEATQKFRPILEAMNAGTLRGFAGGTRKNAIGPQQISILNEIGGTMAGPGMSKIDNPTDAIQGFISILSSFSPVLSEALKNTRVVLDESGELAKKGFEASYNAGRNLIRTEGSVNTQTPLHEIAHAIDNFFGNKATGVEDKNGLRLNYNQDSGKVFIENMNRYLSEIPGTLAHQFVEEFRPIRDAELLISKADISPQERKRQLSNKELLATGLSRMNPQQVAKFAEMQHQQLQNGGIGIFGGEDIPFRKREAVFTPYKEEEPQQPRRKFVAKNKSKNRSILRLQREEAQERAKFNPYSRLTKRNVPGIRQPAPVDYEQEAEIQELIDLTRSIIGDNPEDGLVPLEKPGDSRGGGRGGARRKKKGSKAKAIKQSGILNFNDQNVRLAPLKSPSGPYMPNKIEDFFDTRDDFSVVDEHIGLKPIMEDYKYAADSIPVAPETKSHLPLDYDPDYFDRLDAEEKRKRDFEEVRSSSSDANPFARSSVDAQKPKRRNRRGIRGTSLRIASNLGILGTVKNYRKTGSIKAAIFGESDYDYMDRRDEKLKQERLEKLIAEAQERYDNSGSASRLTSGPLPIGSSNNRVSNRTTWRDRASHLGRLGKSGVSSISKSFQNFNGGVNRVIEGGSLQGTTRTQRAVGRFGRFGNAASSGVGTGLALGGAYLAHQAIGDIDSNPKNRRRGAFGEVATSTLGGIAAGASIGALVSGPFAPVGAAIGAVAGGLIGLTTSLETANAKIKELDFEDTVKEVAKDVNLGNFESLEKATKEQFAASQGADNALNGSDFFTSPGSSFSKLFGSLKNRWTSFGDDDRQIAKERKEIINENTAKQVHASIVEKAKKYNTTEEFVAKEMPSLMRYNEARSNASIHSTLPKAGLISQILPTDKAGNIITNLNTKLDEEIRIFDELNKTIESTRYALEGLNKQINVAESFADGGAGPVSVTNNGDLLRNPSLATADVAGKNIDSLLGRVGQSENASTTKMTSFLVASLPNIIKDIRTSTEPPAIALEDALTKSLTAKFGEDATKTPEATHARAAILGGLSVAEAKPGFAGMSEQELVKQLSSKAQPLLDEIARFDENFAKSANDFIGVFDRTTQSLVQANQDILKGHLTGFQAENMANEFAGNGMVIPNQLAFVESQKRLLGQGGIMANDQMALDPESIVQQLYAAQQESIKLQGDASSGSANITAINQNNERVAVLTNALNNLKSSSSILNETIGKEIEILKSQQSERRGLAEEYFKGDNNDRQRITRGALLAGAFKTGQLDPTKLNQEDRGLFLDTSRKTANNLYGSSQNFEEQFFSKLGQNKEYSFLNTPINGQIKGLQGEMVSNVKRDAQAQVAGGRLQAENAYVARDLASQKFQQELGSFGQSVAAFGNSASQLSAAVAGIPTRIDLATTGTVEVHITGAEVLASLGPEVQKVIDAKLKIGVNRLIDRLSAPGPAGPGIRGLDGAKIG